MTDARFRFLVAALLFVAAMQVRAANRVADASFDEAGVSERWSGIAGKFSVSRGEGLNGSAGLVFENRDPGWSGKPYVTQALKLEPGKSYRLQMWVKSADIAKGPGDTGAAMFLDWLSADGKWIGGQYPQPIRKPSSDWQKVEVVTRRIPAEASRFVLSLMVGKGVTGKVAFDDVLVEEQSSETVSGVYSSAYRDVAADGDRVDFAASLNLGVGEAERRGLRGVFRVVEADGREREIPADTLSADRAWLSVAVSRLARGKSPVEFVLYEADKAVGAAALVFERVLKLPELKVRTDRFGRVLVDGKPFFPFGMYWGLVRRDRLETYAKGPFNSLLTYHVAAPEMMDLCAERGLKVVLPLHDRIFEFPGTPAKSYRNKADELFDVTRVVSTYRGHPALLAWYMTDEMPLEHLGLLLPRRELLNRLDPDHPALGVFCRHDLTRNYLPSVDVLGTDPYPVGGGKPVAFAAESTRAARWGTMGLRSLWQVPQSFDWGKAKKTREERLATPVPTEAQMRSMTWQCIACGANALFYYSFFDFYDMDWKTPFVERWRDMCRVGEEVRRLIPVLLGEPGPETAVIPSSVAVRTWRCDGRTAVLVVNPLSSAVTVSVRIPESHAVEECVFGTKPTSAGEMFEIELGAEEQSFFYVR